MTKALILINSTAAAVDIEDIGLHIPENSSLDCSIYFGNNKHVPASSFDLINLIQADTININDGATTYYQQSAINYLSEYAVIEHNIAENEHNNNLKENRINEDGILARVNFPITITETWQVGANGKIIIENNNIFPTTIATDKGRIFWRSDAKQLYISDNGVWNSTLVTENSRYNAPIVYEFGRSGTLYAGSYLSTSWSVSTSTPVIVPLKGTIKSVCTSSTSRRSYSCSIRKASGTGWTTIATVSGGNNSYFAANNTLDIDFDAGTRFACQVSEGRMENAHCYLEVVWRP